MAKQVLLPLVAVIAFIVLVGFYAKKNPAFNFGATPAPTQTQQTVLTVGTKKINVEIVNSEEARQKGLGGRKSLEENSGMYFVFDTKPVGANFWMKDMLIPIDIIWIKDGKVVKIDKNIPAPAKNTPDSKLKIYNPGLLIDTVLEVNSGYSDKNNIKIGDSVSL